MNLIQRISLWLNDRRDLKFQRQEIWLNDYFKARYAEQEEIWRAKERKWLDHAMRHEGNARMAEQEIWGLREKIEEINKKLMTRLKEKIELQDQILALREEDGKNL